MLGKICLYSALPLTLALAAPFARADAQSDFLQNLQTCNVDPNQIDVSRRQECYSTIRGGIWLTAVSLSQTSETLKNQCNQNPTPPNQDPSLAGFFTTFNTCNVAVAPTNFAECFNILRWGLLIYSNSLNDAKDSLTQCTQPPPPEVYPNQNLNITGAALTSPTLISPTTSTGTVFDRTSTGTNQIEYPQPMINYPQPMINY